MSLHPHPSFPLLSHPLSPLFFLLLLILFGSLPLPSTASSNKWLVIVIPFISFFPSEARPECGRSNPSLCQHYCQEGTVHRVSQVKQMHIQQQQQYLMVFDTSRPTAALRHSSFNMRHVSLPSIDGRN